VIKFLRTKVVYFLRVYCVHICEVALCRGSTAVPRPVDFTSSEHIDLQLTDVCLVDFT